jgi:hypothetical protein
MLPGSTASRPEVRELRESIECRREELDRLATHLAALEQEGVSGYYCEGRGVFQLQHAIRACRGLLASLAPDGAQVNPWLMTICREACRRCWRARFGVEDWQAETRPVLEAFWHCSYFVRMAAAVGREEAAPPARTPGWVAVSELYGLR